MSSCSYILIFFLKIFLLDILVSTYNNNNQKKKKFIFSVNTLFIVRKKEICKYENKVQVCRPNFVGERENNFGHVILLG